MRSIFEFSHFTRAFIWQTIFDPSLFVFFSHLFYCYLSFQKFVKALLMLRTIKSNILLTGSNNLFRNANPNFHEFSDRSELVLQTEIPKNSGAVFSELVFGSSEQDIWLYSYNKKKNWIRVLDIILLLLYCRVTSLEQLSLAEFSGE